MEDILHRLQKFDFLVWWENLLNYKLLDFLMDDLKEFDGNREHMLQLYKNV